MVFFDCLLSFGMFLSLPMIGLLGIDWGYGFDNPTKKDRSQFHFLIGQQF